MAAQEARSLMENGENRVLHPEARRRRVSKDDVGQVCGTSFETPTSQAPQDEGARVAQRCAESGSQAALRSATCLGPFEVSTDASTLARFAAATGASSEGVPTTFPIVWLSHVDIRASILGFARPGEVAFHEEQSFDYRAALVPDTAYALSIDLERIEAPARLMMTSTVVRGSATVLTMRTMLRLVAVPAFAQQQRAVQQ